MMNNKKHIWISILPIVLGCGLLIVSAALLTGNIIRNEQVKRRLPNYVLEIEQLLPQRTVGVIENDFDNAMPAIEIQDENFVGLLELPDLEVKLPVFSVWDQNDDSKRPSLYLGSAYDGSLIIGGDFDFASALDGGEKVTFTDMYGRVFSYRVTTIRHPDNARTETLQSGDCDLTLFTKSGDNYIIVECYTSP